MLSVDALSSMRVMFATPCYASALTSPYVASLYTLAGDLAHNGIANQLELYSESLITRARNMLVAKFLEEPSYTHLFWIDADIQFKTESVVRMLLSDHDVVAGIYPLKQFNWPAEGIPAGMTQTQFEARYSSYPFFPIDDHADEDGFCEVFSATTGFMCIKRRAIKSLMDMYPGLNYTPDGPLHNPRAHLCWRFFDVAIGADGRYLSEDYAFCQRWRDIGGKIYADVDCKLGHFGQHLFKGNLAEKLGVA